MERMAKSGFAYYVFPIASECLEIMGAFYDDKEFSDHGESTARAKRALKKCFKNIRGGRYPKNQKLVFENLRCGFAHMMRPGAEVAVGSLASGDTEDMHWKKMKDGKTIFIAECFIGDLAKAVDNLTNAVAKKKDGIYLDKATEVYLDRDVT